VIDDQIILHGQFCAQLFLQKPSTKNNTRINETRINCFVVMQRHMMRT